MEANKWMSCLGQGRLELREEAESVKHFTCGPFPIGSFWESLKQSRIDISRKLEMLVCGCYHLGHDRLAFLNNETSHLPFF